MMTADTHVATEIVRTRVAAEMGIFTEEAAVPVLVPEVQTDITVLEVIGGIAKK